MFCTTQSGIYKKVLSGVMVKKSTSVGTQQSSAMPKVFTQE